MLTSVQLSIFRTTLRLKWSHGINNCRHANIIRHVVTWCFRSPAQFQTLMLLASSVCLCHLNVKCKCKNETAALTAETRCQLTRSNERCWHLLIFPSSFMAAHYNNHTKAEWVSRLRVLAAASSEIIIVTVKVLHTGPTHNNDRVVNNRRSWG